MKDFESLLDMAGAERPIELIQYDTGDILFEATEKSFGRVLHIALRKAPVLACVDCSERTIYRAAGLTDNINSTAPKGGNMPGAQFKSARLLDCHFQAMGLRGASFKNAQIIGVDFSRSDLRGADFTNAKFQKNQGKIKNNFEDANMEGAYLSRDANLTHANLKNAKNLDKIKIMDNDGTICPHLKIEETGKKIISITS